MVESIEILIHGPECPRWGDPTSPTDWADLQLTEREEVTDSQHVTYTYYDCSVCRSTVRFSITTTISR